MKLPRFLEDRLIRRKMALDRTPLRRFRVRLARTVEDYEAAFRLVQAAYISIGIEDARATPSRILPQHVLPEAWVLIAEEGSQVVGTMTLTLDSPAGLPLDKDYPAELELLRRRGALLCEVGSLAVVARCRHAGVTNLLNFACFALATQTLGGTHLVIGVNPRATPHYRALFDFQPLGRPQPHAQLVAPVAGMACDLSTLHAFLTRAFPRPMETGELAADHCFGAPLPAVELPSGHREDLTRWRMPREVFQELFVRRSDRLATLDAPTREYLCQSRTPRTLGSLRLAPNRLSLVPAE